MCRMEKVTGYDYEWAYHGAKLRTVAALRQLSRLSWMMLPPPAYVFFLLGQAVPAECREACFVGAVVCESRGRTWTTFNILQKSYVLWWCCDDDASLSSISLLKSLIAQHPFCKIILIKLLIFWDRRINVIWSYMYHSQLGKICLFGHWTLWIFFTFRDDEADAPPNGLLKHFNR